MQKIPDNMSEGDRGIARRWGLATASFYGSILAGMVVYAALHPNPELNIASADIKAPISAMKMAHH
jgi:hypothetical protein